MKGMKSTVSFPLIVKTEFVGKSISLFSHLLTNWVRCFLCESWHEHNVIAIRMTLLAYNKIFFIESIYMKATNKVSSYCLKCRSCMIKFSLLTFLQCIADNRPLSFFLRGSKQFTMFFVDRDVIDVSI